MSENGLLATSRHDKRVEETLADIHWVLETYQTACAYEHICLLVRELVDDVHRDVEGYYVERAYQQAVENSTNVLQAVFSGWQLAKGEQEA